MNWHHFQTHNESSTKAFEAMCCQLFELWCHDNYGDQLVWVITINGAGGDGGVESLALLTDDSNVGLQAKWLPDSLDSSSFSQIRNSVDTALKVYPSISKYIVCLPRNLSSQRFGKKGELIKNSERNRWEELTKTINEKHSCELILWDENQLLGQLQKEDTRGIYRHFFEKSEISNESVRYVFEKQLAGWLSTKYIPDLHVCGYISERTQELIGADTDKQGLLKALQKLENLCYALKSECIDYRSFCRTLPEKPLLQNEINKAFSYGENLLKEIMLIKGLLKNDSSVCGFLNSDKWDYSFSALASELEKEGSGSLGSPHKNAFLKAIKSFEEFDVYDLLCRIEKTDQRLLVVLGQPGTGKTHGIVGHLSYLFEENKHVSILIRAKDYHPELGWKSILNQALGLSDNWAELEIMDALESLAFRLEISHRNNLETENNIKSKVLICIDGLDEQVPYDSWIERLREVQIICARNRRIRFCVTCRPYVFGDLQAGDKLRKGIYYLPFDGDTPVYQLYPKYLDYYQINDTKSQWIRWSLKTPFALRVLCNLYKGKALTGLGESAVTITSLLHSTIEHIEEGFCNAFSLSWSKKDSMLLKVLIEINKAFTESNEISRENLLVRISNALSTYSLPHEQCVQLLEYLEDYGLVQSYCCKIEDITALPQNIYRTGIQPVFDYLAALVIIESFDSKKIFEKKPSIVQKWDALLKSLSPKKKKQKLPAHNSWGTLQMMSILLLEDRNYLLTENEIIQNSLGLQQQIELACFALSNVSPEAAGQHVSYVRGLMRESPQRLRQIVNSIVIPVSRVSCHPLGSVFLHEYLESFPSPAQRDLVWSLPSALWYFSQWQIHDQWLLFENEAWHLTEWDSSMGTPLVYTWLLTSCDNNVRAKSRQELAQWALNQPEEYWLLFERVIVTNDPQMKEDLLSIARGLVFTAKEETSCILKFRDWILQNVFAPIAINNNYDAAVRYYCHAIMERCYSLKLISDDQIARSRPPYSTTLLLPIAKEALVGTRMGGYGPIKHDLSRYVLYDHIEHMFFQRRPNNHEVDASNTVADYSDFFSEEEIENYLNSDEGLSEECKAELGKTLKLHQEQREKWEHFGSRVIVVDQQSDDAEITIWNSETEYSSPDKWPMSKEANDLLDSYSKMTGTADIKCDGFIIALAFAFLQKMGWNEEEFFGHPNGGKPGEVLGIDVVINREYWPATHGQMSPVMSFAEKYTWCARNEIYGFLADRLPFYDEYESKKLSFLDDYCQLDSFVNPVQELHEFSHGEMREETLLFDDSQYVKEYTSDGSGLKKWIYEAPIPDFIKWINPDNTIHPLIEDGWITLSGYSSLTNALHGEALVWISTGMISKQDFPLFLKDMMNRKKALIQDLDNPSNYFTSAKAHSSLTPKEICWMNWKDNYENPVCYITIDSGEFACYELIKCVEECFGHYHNKGDVHYKLPSKQIRQYLEISDGDGLYYRNDNSDIVAKFSKIGEGWENSQSFLWADRERLLNELENDDKALFWIIRLQRQASFKGMERYPEAREQYDRCWLYWFEDGKYNNLLFKEVVR